MSDEEVKTVLARLFAIIESRKGADPSVSRTALLFHRGVPRIAQKVGEEAVEAVIAATRGSADEVVTESADLLYHLLVLWSAMGLKPEDVYAELVRREGTSGIEEKSRRAAKG
ncbi:MAG TPA: phosphoribosyl-ATP diphosphatase [Alphaproteobacteria bacterium]|nr:phosphoribosyl-ATP diphosphatase [Alphaproteobacteria bacterium]